MARASVGAKRVVAPRTVAVTAVSLVSSPLRTLFGAVINLSSLLRLVKAPLAVFEVVVEVNYIKWMLEIDEKEAGVVRIIGFVVLRPRHLNFSVLASVFFIDFSLELLFGVLIRYIHYTQVRPKIFSRHNLLYIDSHTDWRLVPPLSAHMTSTAGALAATASLIRTANGIRRPSERERVD